MVSRSALAPAKVNLFLHVGAVGAGDYHPLTSLAAFADVGDRIGVSTSERLSLTLDGPFARGLEGDDDNLILRALRLFGDRVGIGEPALAVHLDKRLPIAAGLGGGSSDAGAALKLARDLLVPDMNDDDLAEIAGIIGSDGPLCLHARAAWAQGRGDILTPEPELPPLPALLVNPGAPSPTGAVYRAYDGGVARAADRPADPDDWTLDAVIDWLADQRNDLEEPAVRLSPAIGEVMSLVRALPGVRLTRMSGSGATVFALFDDLALAHAAGAALQTERPAWWIASATLS